ncbi:MAG: NgoFVII family restriction endonuclease [Bacteroidetes bacterium]|nr:NgoFVII family restriction endonuclease [Bacteroidota bacterium]
MITTALFEEVLIKPAQISDELRIVSGYATPAMAFRHLSVLSDMNLNIKVNLIVGMTPQEGISLTGHKGFKKIMGDIFKDCFQCSYLQNLPPVHSKLYIWLKDGRPVQSYLGSANYTQKAFNGLKQMEILAGCDRDIALDYFNDLEKNSIYCDHPDVETSVLIYTDSSRTIPKQKRKRDKLPVAKVSDYSNQSLENITISLIPKSGIIQKVGGLNWGQRSGRNHNQAYIQLPPEVYKSEFFPIRGTHFTVITDDGKTLICTRAQKNNWGAAIHTPHNNSLLGEYFRNRLGVASGAFIQNADLKRYGRDNVTFYKIDDENYYMDFSN